MIPCEEVLKNKFVHPVNEWRYVSFKNEYCEINTFDDGNNKYKKYENKWIIFGRWRGKLALYNLIDPLIIIHSISLWKVNNTIKIQQTIIEDI